MRWLGIAVVAAVLIGGCGGSKRKTASVTPTPTKTPVALKPLTARGQALAAFAPDTPVVALVTRNFEHPTIKALVGKVKGLPYGSDKVFGALKGRLNRRGIDLDKDVRPLLGPSPIVIGMLGNGQLQASLTAKSQRALTQMLDQREAEQRSGAAPSYRGVRISLSRTLALGADRNVLIAAQNIDQLHAAIDVRRGPRSGQLSIESVDQRLKGLQKGGAVNVLLQGEAIKRRIPDPNAGVSEPEVCGPVPTGPSGPSGATGPIECGPGESSRGPWLDALTGVGISLRADGKRIIADYRVDTTHNSLRDADLPIAQGNPAPKPSGDGDLVIGVTDLRRIVKLVGFEDPATAHLTGTATVLLDQKGGRRLRVPVDAPITVDHAIPHLADTLGYQLHGVGDGFYDLLDQAGQRKYTAGVANGVFVFGTSDKSGLTALSTAAPKGVSGAAGALTFRIKRAVFQRNIVSMFGLPGIATSFIPVGDLNGFLRGAPDGLTGRATLGIG